jgi:hypothetical protein
MVCCSVCGMLCNMFISGVPSRLRTDRGGENRVVGMMMLWLRGTGRNSFMVGRSVHNQRIERFWRDATNCVTRYECFIYCL